MDNNANQQNIIKEALQYAENGFSIIPIKPEDKTPYVEWKKYQSKKADEKQIKEWFSQFPDMNIATVTGKISGIVVVDVDEGGSTENLPATLISQTGGNGWHYFYKYPNKNTKSVNGFRNKVDVKADGGYVILPPSQHISGKKYRWSFGDFDLKLMDKLPLWISQELSKDSEKKTDWKKLLQEKILEGERNTTATKIAGMLLYNLPMEIWEEAGWLALKKWNEKNCIPPEKEKALRSTWESLVAKETAKRTTGTKKITGTTKNKTSRMLKIIEEMKDISYFHEGRVSAYIRIPEDDHFELISCKSKKLELWLTLTYYQTYGDSLSSSSIKEVKNILMGKAFTRGENLKLYNRVASHNNSIYYDLADKGWKSVKITRNGWQVLDDTPPLFKRFQHQKSQSKPKKGGNVKRLLEYINVADEDSGLLILIFLISCFIEGFPHPIINIYGRQGSAKSTLSKIIKRLVDPSEIETASVPRNQNDLIQQLSHHWLIFYDNLSKIDSCFSDDLCKAVTGTGFSKRELYTDDDDIIYSFQRCVGLNGVNFLTIKPDLLERSLLIELKSIPKSKKRDVNTLLDKFDEDRPFILGSIFDILSKAIKIKETLILKESYRMADFTSWGAAIAEALGYQKEKFLLAYQRNISRQNSELLFDSQEAITLVKFMENKLEWKGTASELLKLLTNIAQKEGFGAEKEKSFPKQANILSRNLFQLEVNFEENGLILKKIVENKERFILIKRQK